MYARQWIEADRADEEAHRSLMRMLAYAGERTAALAQYEACCRALREELDVGPSQETVALYEAIRDERLAIGVPAQAPDEAPAPGQLLQDQYDLVLLLSAEAYQMVDNAQSRGGMATALESSPSFAGFLHSHVGAVSALAFSPDDRTLAVAGADAAIELWDVNGRQPDGDLLLGHTTPAHALAFGPDGEDLASGACAELGEDGSCHQGEIILWALESGQSTVLPVEHSRYVEALAYDPMGRYMASAGDDTVVVWDVATGTVARRLSGHEMIVVDIQFSPDGSVLATGGCESFMAEVDVCARGDIILWDVATGEMLNRVTDSQLSVDALAFSSDGQLLASSGCGSVSFTPNQDFAGCDYGRIRIWDVATMQPVLLVITSHLHSVMGVAFVNEDAWLLSTSLDETIRFWDVQTGEAVAAPVADYGQGTRVALSSDRTLLATADDWAETIQLWNVSTVGKANRLRVASTFATTPLPLTSMALNPDETILAAAGYSPGINLWRYPTGEPVGEPMLGHTDAVWGLAFSPDGRILASASTDTTIRLWDGQSGEALGPVLEGHVDRVNSVAFSPNGEVLASASDDTTVRLWDTRTWQPLGPNQGTLTAHASSVWDVTFSPDGLKMATAGAIPERGAILWDIGDPHEPTILARFPTNAAGGATQVRFSPDGGTLAVSVGNGTLELWDTETYQLRYEPIPAHLTTAYPTQFSPDGRILASGGVDSRLRLTDVASGRLVGPPFALHPEIQAGAVTGLAFLSDGKALVSGGFNMEGQSKGIIYRWDVDPASWLAQVCTLAGRNLTQTEWRQYLPDEPYHATCPQWPAGE